MTNQTTLLADSDASPSHSAIAQAGPSPSGHESRRRGGETQVGRELGQQSTPAPNSLLLEHLIQITLRLRLRGADIESSTGLSGRELDLIALLTASGRTSVKSLVADLGLPRSTMTAIVDRLEDRGLLKRMPNLDDRRSVILEATPIAFDALVKYREAMMGFVKHLEGVLGVEEERQLIRLIEKIAASL